MNSKDRALIRQFYQAIPTAEEKELFETIMGSDKNMRGILLAKFLQETGAEMSPELQLVIAAATFTKEDRIMVFSGVARQLIFRFLSFLGL